MVTSDVTTPKEKYFWICLSLLFLSFSWISSFNAGYGWWESSGAGIKFWHIWDPGGAYLANGINLFEYNVRDRGFMGHPGLPLTFMIAVIARVYYWTSGAAFGHIPYRLFAAKNLQSIIFFSRLAITVFHLLSFYVLYRFSVDLIKSRRASMIAVLGYATTLFALIYVNNLSPEPFLLIFILLALMWGRTIPELLSRGARRNAYLRAALAGVASVMAFYTKFMLAAPLLVFLPVFILSARHNSEPRGNNRNSRIAAMSIFTGVALLVFLLGTALVNWGYVIKGWMVWAPGKPQPVTGGVLANAWNLLVVTVPALIANIANPTSWMPGLGPQHIFNLVEIGFVVFSVVGLVLYWRSHKSERNYLGWLIAFLLLHIPVLSYRAGGHYKVIHLAIGAVFFGYAIDRLAQRFSGRYPIFSHSFAVAVLFVLLVHGASLTIGVLAKRGDVVKARQWEPYYTALSEISYDGHIGIIGNPKLQEVSGMVTAFGHSSPTANAFNQFFINIDPDMSSEELAARKIQVVLEVDQDGTVRPRVTQPNH